MSFIMGRLRQTAARAARFVGIRLRRRIKRWENNKANPHATVRTGQNMIRILDKAEGGNKRIFARWIDTKIPLKKSHARISSMLEQYYETLLDSGKYTEDHMLVVLDPYCQAPLTAIILFTTKESCAVNVRLEDGEDYSMTTERGKRHRIPIFYLHAGKKNEVTVNLLDKDGNECMTKKLYLHMNPLPKSLEDMIGIDKKTMTGVTPMTLVFGGDTKYPYVFDEKGEVRYYLRRRPKSYGVILLSEGHFLFLSRYICAPSFANPHSVLCQEMDFLGRVYHEYYVPEGIHHDGCEMTPGGNLLVASSSMTQWVEDSVVEIDRKTGEVVKSLAMDEVLSDHPYFNYFDWAHVNTVSYEAGDHSVVVCMRNLHTVMKVDWLTNELKWIFCDTEFWKDTVYAEKVLQPEGDISFCYQPHASYMLENDGREKRLIIYDNHYCKRRPVESFDGDENSYVKIYVLDEENYRVRQEHLYTSEKTPIRSNGILSDGRVLSMNGCLLKDINGYGGTITEFDYESEKVINRYLVRKNFYRAYPFSACHENYCCPMPVSDRYLVGANINWERCDDTRLAAFSLVKGFKKKINIYEGVLLVYEKDHEIGKVWVRGKDQTYAVDYYETEQKVPSKFASFEYNIALPIWQLPPDEYEIYLEMYDDGEIYKTGQTFTIK